MYGAAMFDQKWAQFLIVIPLWSLLFIGAFFYIKWQLAQLATQRENQILLVGFALMTVLPFASCASNLMNNGIDEQKIDAAFINPKETTMRVPLTTATLCLLNHETFTADVVFRNLYRTPLYLRGVAMVMLTASEAGEHIPEIPPFLVFRSDVADKTQTTSF
jgi:hypothetical protein